MRLSGRASSWARVFSLVLLAGGAAGASVATAPTRSSVARNAPLVSPQPTTAKQSLTIGLDPNFYPAPASPGMGDYRSGGPSLAGVDSSARPSLDQLAQALFDLGGSQTEALQVTDPAFWPMILTNKYGTYYGGGSRPVSQLVSLLVVTPVS